MKMLKWRRIHRTSVIALHAISDHISFARRDGWVRDRIRVPRRPIKICQVCHLQEKCFSLYFRACCALHFTTAKEIDCGWYDQRAGISTHLALVIEQADEKDDATMFEDFWFISECDQWKSHQTLFFHVSTTSNRIEEKLHFNKWVRWWWCRLETVKLTFQRNLACFYGFHHIRTWPGNERNISFDDVSNRFMMAIVMSMRFLQNLRWASQTAIAYLWSALKWSLARSRLQH